MMHDDFLTFFTKVMMASNSRVKSVRLEQKAYERLQRELNSMAVYEDRTITTRHIKLYGVDVWSDIHLDEGT